ncbi:MAG: LemA family protein [Solirubrobacterales bacterium]
MAWWVYLFFALLIVVLFGLALFNMAVKARNQAEESWSGVDIQLKRRRDLIPNLVAAVQAYATHEAGVLQTVTETRALAQSAAQSGASAAVPAENHLTGALRGLFVVVERYPQLKADQNFLQLQNELVKIENNVTGARAIYNSNARRLNDRLQTFPGNLYLGTFGLRTMPYVEAAAHERGVGRVDFS